MEGIRGHSRGGLLFTASAAPGGEWECICVPLDPLPRTLTKRRARMMDLIFAK